MTRSEASRTNGAQSHGPVTPEGKARSSMNALKHGLTARDMCIAVENPKEFDAFQQRYFDEFQPATQVELDLIKEMISAKWRQERIWNLEAATIDFRMECTKPDIDKHWILPPRTRAAIAMMEEATGSKSLQTYSRYDAMLSRMYHRALRTLTLLRATPMPEPAAIEPETIVETEVTPTVTPGPVRIAVLQNEPAPPSTSAARTENDAPDNPAAPPLPRAA